VRLTAGGFAPAARRGIGRTGRELRPDEIAQVLEGWRPEVLRRMRARRLWRGAPPADLEDQFQDVALVLCMRAFRSEEHLRRALWTGLGFRARDFWKAGRRRELPVAELFESDRASDCNHVEEDAAAAADQRYVDDCLSELDTRERAVYRLVRGEELSRRNVAKAVEISEADVLRALHSAQLKVDRFALLLVRGRLCARRAEAIGALARSQADGDELEQARAHLAHCRECLLAFRVQRARLSGRVASLLPVPSSALADETAAHGGALGAHAHELAVAVKRHAYALAGREPKTATGAEAVAGAGAGGVAATKLVVLCVTAAAGGGAVCVQTLGLFTNPLQPPPQKAPAHHARTKTAARNATSSVATHDPPPAPAAPIVARSAPAHTKNTRAAPRKAQARSSQPSQPQQEFFDAPNGSGGTARTSAPAVHSASTSHGSTHSSGSSGSSSSGGGSEFFGG
jgi:RNA polymerase sigma factor (sigma-70 family)